MKKNLRVVQINGFRGLLLTIFIVSCLFAGFAIFPAFVAMNIWNFLALKTSSFPLINLGEALLLWSIIAFSAYIFNKKKFIVSFKDQEELTEEEMKNVISKIRAQGLNHNNSNEKNVNEELEVPSKKR